MTIKDKVRGKMLAELEIILNYHKTTFEANATTTGQEILSLKIEDRYKLEIIDTKPELPETELTNEDFKELNEKTIEEMTENWRIGGRRPTAEFAGKRLSVLTARKQDAKTRGMLKEGWVKKV